MGRKDLAGDANAHKDCGLSMQSEREPYKLRRDDVFRSHCLCLPLSSEILGAINAARGRRSRALNSVLLRSPRWLLSHTNSGSKMSPG